MTWTEITVRSGLLPGPLDAGRGRERAEREQLEKHLKRFRFRP